MDCRTELVIVTINTIDCQISIVYLAKHIENSIDQADYDHQFSKRIIPWFWKTKAYLDRTY